MAQVSIYDVIFIERKVELPESCPHEGCDADFTDGANLREWDWHDVQYVGNLIDGEEGKVFEVEGDEDSGETHMPCDFWCGSCGKQVVKGGGMVTADLETPVILGETLDRRLREARGEG